MSNNDSQQVLLQNLLENGSSDRRGLMSFSQMSFDFSPQNFKTPVKAVAKNSSLNKLNSSAQRFNSDPSSAYRTNITPVIFRNKDKSKSEIKLDTDNDNKDFSNTQDNSNSFDELHISQIFNELPSDDDANSNKVSNNDKSNNEFKFSLENSNSLPTIISQPNILQTPLKSKHSEKYVNLAQSNDENSKSLTRTSSSVLNQTTNSNTLSKTPKYKNDNVSLDVNNINSKNFSDNNSVSRNISYHEENIYPEDSPFSSKPYIFRSASLFTTPAKAKANTDNMSVFDKLRAVKIPSDFSSPGVKIDDPLNKKDFSSSPLLNSTDHSSSPSISLNLGFSLDNIGKLSNSSPKSSQNEPITISKNDCNGEPVGHQSIDLCDSDNDIQCSIVPPSQPNEIFSSNEKSTLSKLQVACSQLSQRLDNSNLQKSPCIPNSSQNSYLISNPPQPINDIKIKENNIYNDPNITNETTCDDDCEEDLDRKKISDVHKSKNYTTTAENSIASSDTEENTEIYHNEEHASLIIQEENSGAHLNLDENSEVRLTPLKDKLQHLESIPGYNDMEITQIIPQQPQDQSFFSQSAASAIANIDEGQTHLKQSLCHSTPISCVRDINSDNCINDLKGSNDWNNTVNKFPNILLSSPDFKNFSHKRSFNSVQNQTELPVEMDDDNTSDENNTPSGSNESDIGFMTRRNKRILRVIEEDDEKDDDDEIIEIGENQPEEEVDDDKDHAKKNVYNLRKRKSGKDRKNHSDKTDREKKNTDDDKYKIKEKLENEKLSLISKKQVGSKSRNEMRNTQSKKQENKLLGQKLYKSNNDVNDYVASKSHPIIPKKIKLRIGDHDSLHIDKKVNSDLSGFNDLESSQNFTTPDENLTHLSALDTGSSLSLVSSERSSSFCVGDTEKNEHKTFYFDRVLAYYIPFGYFPGTVLNSYNGRSKKRRNTIQTPVGNSHISYLVKFDDGRKEISPMLYYLILKPGNIVCFWNRKKSKRNNILYEIIEMRNNDVRQDSINTCATDLNSNYVCSYGNNTIIARKLKTSLEEFSKTSEITSDNLQYDAADLICMPVYLAYIPNECILRYNKSIGYLDENEKDLFHLTNYSKNGMRSPLISNPELDDISSKLSNSNQNKKETSDFLKTMLDSKSKHISINNLIKKSGIFARIAFVLTGMEDELKNKVTTYIKTNGGTILEDGLFSLFSEISQTEKYKKKNNPIASELKLAFVISEDICRTFKYLQALSLGWPCLSTRYVMDCVEINHLLPWSPYLLSAGSSRFLYNRVKSMDISLFTKLHNEGKSLSFMMDHREKQYFFNSKILILTAKDKMNKPENDDLAECEESDDEILDDPVDFDCKDLNILVPKKTSSDIAIQLFKAWDAKDINISNSAQTANVNDYLKSFYQNSKKRLMRSQQELQAWDYIFIGAGNELFWKRYCNKRSRYMNNGSHSGTPLLSIEIENSNHTSQNTCPRLVNMEWIVQSLIAGFPLYERSEFYVL